MPDTHLRNPGCRRRFATCSDTALPCGSRRTGASILLPMALRPGLAARVFAVLPLPGSGPGRAASQHERAREMRQRGPFGSCKHGEVTQLSSGRLRTAKAEDDARLLRLWAFLFDEGGTTSEEPLKSHARERFTRHVDDTRNARFPAIEVDGEHIATAVGTLEIGVPSPQVRPEGHCAPRERYYPAQASRPGARNDARAQHRGLGPIDCCRPGRPERRSRRAAPLREARLHDDLSPAHEARSLTAPSGDPAPTASCDDRARASQHRLQHQKWIT